MRIVLDIETNSKLVERVKHIWVVVTKDIDTGQINIFRKVTEDAAEKERLRAHLQSTSMVVGHNILEYDLPILSLLLGLDPIPLDRVVDTLILSRLLDYARPGGHSIEQYGEEYGLEKIKFSDFTQYSQELETYCIRDVEINQNLYNHLISRTSYASCSAALSMEQAFQLIINDMHRNGFCFDRNEANKLHGRVIKELEELDGEIQKAFPAKLTLVREIHPRLTQHGTLNKSDFRFVKGGDLSEYNGGPFCRCTWRSFNAASPKQVVRVLSNAGWKPTVKTKTHLDCERSFNRLKYRRGRQEDIDKQLEQLYGRLETLKVFGWKINEENLGTLPLSAPSPARLLARRILIESRRRTLTEWLGLVQDDDRIHGKFYGIGAWTHRMAHQQPNTANIPTDAKLYGHEMRALWRAPRKRLLVGVDAEGIQWRIAAHYINDIELTKALINGRKSDKTDIHSINQKFIGATCKSRQASKRFVYAILLGGGLSTFTQILECSESEAKAAVDCILQRYPGIDFLRREIIPSDAERGYFKGLDGREVRVPGDTVSERKHLMMSGYLQNGEAIIMKKATLKWYPEVCDEDPSPTTFRVEARTSDQNLLVNLVHDEWQTETPNDMAKAIRVAETIARSLREVGEELNLNCPMQGSFYNDDAKDYSIGPNWAFTH